MNKVKLELINNPDYDYHSQFAAFKTLTNLTDQELCKLYDWYSTDDNLMKVLSEQEMKELMQKGKPNIGRKLVYHRCFKYDVVFPTEEDILLTDDAAISKEKKCIIFCNNYGDTKIYNKKELRDILDRLEEIYNLMED